MNIKYYLDKPSAITETAIYLFVRSGSKTLKFNTGRRILPKQWDGKGQKVMKAHGNSIKFNLFLNTLRTDVSKALDDLSCKGVTTLEEARDTVAAIVEKGSFQEEKINLLEAFQLFLNAYKISRSSRTVEKYETLLKQLQAFAKHKHIRLTFDSLDLTFQEGLVAYLIHQVKLTNNTIAKKISLFKTFLHWAADRGYNTKAEYKKFKQKEEHVDIITLTHDELMSLINLDLSGKPRLERVRDVFCFGCFTGQRFSDIVGLQPDHIKGDRWQLHTQKTKDSISVPLNDYALEILTKYTSKGQKLPSVSNQKTNDYLKDLGELAGIDEPVTHTRYQGVKKIQRTEPKHKFLGTHTARRTFITLSLEKGMRPEVVMKISGHKNYRTFQKYINLTSKAVESEMKAIWSK